MKKNIFRLFLMGVIAISFPSCHGILEGIYDEPETDERFGFFDVTAATQSGSIYLDATSDTVWTYIDFDAEEIAVRTIDVAKKEIRDGEPEEWDFAIHRWDVKTNEGSALETQFTSLNDLRASGRMPEGTLVADTQGEVIIDKSQMMNGILIGMESPVNTEMAKWMNVDTSEMPPIYTKSDKVYLMKMKDGKYAALFLLSYMDKSFRKGIMTIDYIYPLEF